MFLLDKSNTEDLAEEEFELEAHSNIWRKHFDMRHDFEASDSSKDHNTSRGLCNGDYIASHERATIWKGHRHEVDIVIILLDPGHSKSVKSSAHIMPILSKPRQKILGQDRSGNAVRITQKLEANRQTTTPGAENPDDTEEASRFDRVNQTYIRVRSNHVLPQTMIAYDLPWMVESDEYFMITQYIDHDLQREVFNHTKRLQAEIREHLDLQRPPFANMVARTPLEGVNIQEARAQNWLRPATTTKDDLLAWLDTTVRPIYETDDVGPGSDIYWIVRNDTLDMISLTNSFIDKAVELSNDENKLVKNLSRWRGMISFLEAEYRRFAQDIRTFPKFTRTGTAWHFSYPAYQMVPEVDKEHKFLTEEIRMVRLRLDSALTSLVSAVSVVESRRGIAEAESVTKLTELGMLHGLPLTSPAISAYLGCVYRVELTI